METKPFWKSRKSYQRLEDPFPVSTPRQRRSRRRIWRVKVTRPRLGFVRRALNSPRRVLARIRDAYVSMMLRFASSGAFAGDLGYGADAGVFVTPAVKEYDEKVIVEIYKSLVAKRHLAVVSGADGVPTAAR